MDRIPTCNFGVRTEIKRAIVVSRRVCTVGGEVLPDSPLGEIQEVYHVLGDCAVVQFEGGGVETLIVVRDGKALDVRRPNPGIVYTVVGHMVRGRGNGGRDGFAMGASDISQTAGGTPNRMFGRIHVTKMDGRSMMKLSKSKAVVACVGVWTI